MSGGMLDLPQVGGGGGAAVSDEVVGGTAGSVLFVGADGSLAQDNTHLYWDITNTRLGVDVSTTPAASLDVGIAVSASGTPAHVFQATGAAHTAITASTEWNALHINLAQTYQWATGPLATQRFVRINAPTIAFVGASTVTEAATVSISGPPIKGTNATLSKTHALLIEAGSVSTAAASYGLTVNAQSGGTANYCAAFLGGDVGIGISTPVATLDVTQAATESGLPGHAFQVTGGTHVAITASTEWNAIHVNLTQPYQWAAGALTNQRFIYVEAPNISFASASTVTDAATLYVAGAPSAGSNATLTWKWAAWLEGNVQIGEGGLLAVALGVPTPILRVTGPALTGAAVAATNSIELTPSDVTFAAGGGSITVQSAVSVGQPTYAAAAAMTITDAATVTIWGAPVKGANVTMSATHALLIEAGAASTATASYGLTVNTQTGATANYCAALLGADVGVGTATPAAALDVLDAASTGSPSHLLQVTGCAHTTLTASTEWSAVHVNLAQTYQWATGALAAQRFFAIDAPTVAFVGASTVTDVATLYASQPLAGANATLTNQWASWRRADSLGATQGVGANCTTGVLLSNETAAAAGAQQYSPLNVQRGYGWKTNATAASQAVEFATQVQPVQGAAAPTGNLVWYRRVNMPTTTAWTQVLDLSSAGVLQMNTAAALQWGGTGNSITGDQANGYLTIVSPFIRHNPSIKYFTPSLTIGSQWNTQTATAQDGVTGVGGTNPAYQYFAIQAPTLQATNASTTTDATVLGIYETPKAGTNETITNGWVAWFRRNFLSDWATPIGTNNTTGVLISNETAATAGPTNQYSPLLVLRGYGYTAASAAIEFGWQTQPATATTGLLSCLFRAGGTGAWTQLLTISQTGALAVPSLWATAAVYTPYVICASTDAALFLKGNRAAATATADVYIRSSVARNAGTPLLIVDNNAGAALITVQAEGNLLVGPTASGASAAKCLVLTNAATAPSASADMAHLYAADAAGAGTAALALWQEFAPYVSGDVASTHKIPVVWNGATYYLLATTQA